MNKLSHPKFPARSRSFCVRSMLGLSIFLICFAQAMQGQIIIDITDNGNGGIDMVASGSAIVTPRGTQYYNIGVNNFGCAYVDEDFQDLCLNGFQTTINGGPWAFSQTGGYETGVGPGINWNGAILNSFQSSPSYFALWGQPCCTRIPRSNGLSPISPTGSISFPNMAFSYMPGAPGQGGTTIIDLYGAGEIIFRLNALPPVTVPALSEWGIIILGLLLLCAGAIVLVRRKELQMA